MNRLGELINDFGYRQIDFPKVCGYSRNTVYKMINELSDIDSKKIETFCNIFDVTSDYLLGRSTIGIHVIFDNKKYTLDRMHYTYYKKNGLIDIRDQRRYFINISVDNIMIKPNVEFPEIELINLNI